MHRRAFILATACAALSACAGTAIDGSGVYRIRDKDADEIRVRTLDSVNALRQGRGLQPIQLNPQLTASAQSHAADMSRQQRAWAFGADGSSPYDRLRRSGFYGALVGEAYSQSFETEAETLSAWMSDGAWSGEILAADATDMGLGWHQDNNGLIWWVLVMGNRFGNPSPLS